MNPELILSFFVMQGLAPAGTSVPVEAVLTSADAMPAWARFTFQTHLIQGLQADLNKCKADAEELRTHHTESHEKSAVLKKEIVTLFQTLRGELGCDPGFHKVVGSLVARGGLPTLTAMYASLENDENDENASRETPASRENPGPATSHEH